jgi:Cu(I)/Ag(I) efflux system membrane protein CusA/SilA
MLLYLNLAWARVCADKTVPSAADLREAVVEGALQRLRPKLMTVGTTIAGLTPILWSTGAGADTMRRMAVPMIGGLVTSFLMELIVYPAIFFVWRGWSLPPGAPTPVDRTDGGPGTSEGRRTTHAD